MPYKDLEAKRAYQKAYHQAHRDKKNAFSRQFYAEHRDELRGKGRLYRAKHRQKYREYGVMWKLKKLEKDAGQVCPKQCEICDRTQLKRLSFDHDHETGKFRGWVCYKCNTVLGLVDDDPRMLQKIINFLNEKDIKTKYRTL